MYYSFLLDVFGELELYIPRLVRSTTMHSITFTLGVPAHPMEQQPTYL
jgi:hypothetical protein